MSRGGGILTDAFFPTFLSESCVCVWGGGCVCVCVYVFRGLEASFVISEVVVFLGAA